MVIDMAGVTWKDRLSSEEVAEGMAKRFTTENKIEKAIMA